MLALHSRAGAIREPPEDLGAAALPPDVVWIDLVQPSADETAFVERATGVKVPSFEDLSEIESSSRLRVLDGVLYLSAPLVFRTAGDDPQTTPVGFILNAEHFITVRFENPEGVGHALAWWNAERRRSGLTLPRGTRTPAGSDLNQSPTR